MFADVTLSCEDNKQNEAHGIMMSITSESSSEKNKHPNPFFHEEDII